MFSDFPPDDGRLDFWKGVGLAVALGSAAWLGGLAFAAFVGWYAERVG